MERASVRLVGRGTGLTGPEQWVDFNRKGQQDRVLAGHVPDAVIYDVRSPMRYEASTLTVKAEMNGSPIHKTKSNSIFRRVDPRPSNVGGGLYRA